MTPRIHSILRRIPITILLLICIGIPLSGCTKAAEPETTQGTTQGTTQDVPQGTPPVGSTSPTNNTTITEQPNTEPNPTVSETEGLPSGVTVTKVIKDVALQNNYHKKVDLLSDGGKRVTITDSNGRLVTLYLEYDGIIQAVNGDEVTVQVERGGEQTLTIPSEVVIEDEDHVGLNKGVEIEWVVNSNGQIESVELEKD